MQYLKILLASLFFSAPVVAETNSHYAIIVDGGSSGSRLHLFQYSNENNQVVISEKFAEDIKPGLSSYADHPEKAGEPLKKLFDDASNLLKEKHIDPKNVSVDILSTAGMRLLDTKQQEAIYANVKSYLNANYTFPLHRAETISGKMEAVYGWLDVNYLEDRFVPGKTTMGTIDMGGASTEIAFATQDTSKADDLVTLKLNNQTYNVFGKTFLGLGQDQARFAVNQDPLAAACYPTGYITYNTGNTNQYNFNDCNKAYEKVIAHYQVEQQLIPFDQMEFAVFSGAYYTYNFFGVEDAEKLSLEARMNHICTMQWEDMKKEYADAKIPEDYLSAYCANGVFLDNLFYNTYHLNGSQMWVTSKTHKGSKIDWTLGAMLYNLL